MPLTERTRAPGGWEWASRPMAVSAGASRRNYGELRPVFLTTVTSDEVEEAFRNLKTWADEKLAFVTLYIGDVRQVVVDGVVKDLWVPDRVAVGEQGSEGVYWDPWWPSSTCRYGTDHGLMYANFVCRCGSEPEVLACGTCNDRSSPPLWSDDDNEYKCRQCAVPCTSCGAYTNVAFTLCVRCDTGRVECDSCQLSLSPTAVSNRRPRQHLSRTLCTTCFRRICSLCGGTNERVSPWENGSQYCSPCLTIVRNNSHETHDPSAGEFQPLVNDAHRPIRTCSVELETARGGSQLAAALYGAGLSVSDHVGRYHSSGDGICHVEADSSLGSNGGEVILNRLRVDQPGDVSSLNNVLGIIRGLVEQETLAIDIRCGTHIHIDAHKFDIGSTRNLILITNYLEDVLFRLSAAHYQFHRGTTATIPLPKEEWADNRAFAMSFFATNEHHSALNVSNYWTAIRQNCSCGAATVGEHDTCECNLGKCTFEFRFFNGTANATKLHAYVALCQSLVSFAKVSPPVKSEEFPPLEYHGSDRADSTDELKNAWEERLRWMLQHLYFSPQERDSLRYTINASKMAELGVERLDSIFEVEYERPNAPAQTVEHKNPRGAPNQPQTRQDRLYTQLMRSPSIAWPTPAPDSLDYDVEEDEEF